MDEWNLMRFEPTSRVCDVENDPNVFHDVQNQNQYSPTCAQCGGMGYTLPRKSRLIGSQNTWSRKWFATESLYSADMRREYCSRATFLANLLSRTNLFFSCKSSVLRNEWYRQWEVRCIELIKPMYKYLIVQWKFLVWFHIDKSSSNLQVNISPSKGWNERKWWKASKRT